MSLCSFDDDTICSVSTPPGVGGISVIRVSGPDSLFIVQKITECLPKIPESHRIYYGWIKNSKDKKLIDQVLISFFAEKRSFTGEQVLEISGHGGDFLAQKILSELIANGCRIAQKGEFTYRAFINNKIDLVQAESVLSLVDGKNELSNHLAASQLKGDLSHVFGGIEEDIIDVLAHLEANIDFADEDIDVESQSLLIDKSRQSLEKIAALVESYSVGRVYMDGLNIGLLGAPNVGKSSLLNSWLGKEKAIVTHIPGTTRDLVEGTRLFDGISVKFIDTAGLRTTEDLIEQIGIQKAKELIKKVDYIFCVIDLTELMTMTAKNIQDAIVDIFSEVPNAKKVIVGTKRDLLSGDCETKIFGTNEELTLGKLEAKKNDQADSIGLLDIESLCLKKYILKVFEKNKNGLSGENYQKVFEDLKNLDEKSFLNTSDKLTNGLESIEGFLSDLTNQPKNGENQVILQLRHFELLNDVKKNVSRAMLLMKDCLSPEFPAFELKEALLGIQKILGKDYDDEVVDKIFSQFCLGK